MLHFPTPKNKTANPGKDNEVIGGPDNGHATLIRPNPVPRDNATDNRATKALSAFRVSTVECSTGKANPEDHE